MGDDPLSSAYGTARQQEQGAILSLSGPERAWPASFAFVTAWILPATTTARMARVSLLSAWAVHFAACLALTGILIVFAAVFACVVLDDSGLSWMIVGAKLTDWWHAAVRALWTRPIQSLVLVAMIFSVVVVSFAALALLVLPFGARCERFRDSVRHALRRTWLQTPHLVVVVACASLVAIVLVSTDRNHDSGARAQYHELYPPPEKPADVNDAEAMDNYANDYSEWNEGEWMFVRDTRPWNVKYADEFCAWSWLSGITWFVWALWRGAAAARVVDCVPLEPLCRACGYNLTGRPPEALCPECGWCVGESIFAMPVRGVPWEHRASEQKLNAYQTTYLTGLIRPTTLARRLRLGTSKSHSLRFLGLNLAICGLVVVVGCCVAVHVSGHSGTDLEDFMITPVFWATSAVGMLLAVTSIAAIVAGTNVLIRDRHNVLAGVIQVASYASGFHVVWAAVSMLLLVCIAPGHDVYLFKRIGARAAGGTVFLDLWAAANVLAAVVYIILVVRASAGVRYARH
jgi:hypothetical protein